MKRTRLWKYVSFIIMTGIISFTSAPVHAAGMSTECVRSTVKAGKIVWRYMNINGQLYRRGFNLDTGEWETDWELVSW